MVGVLCLIAASLSVGSAPGASALFAEDKPPQAGSYRLGPGDEIKVHEPNTEELDGKPVRIDESGFATLPVVGRIKLGGITVEEAEAQLRLQLSRLLVNPQPVVSITEFRSQPVSVLGAVNNPGVVQLQGRKTLIEMLSLAGGLRADASGVVIVTRRITNGRVPVSDESLDSSGAFSTAKIDANRLVKGLSPEDNILILSQDVISVPVCDLIYVAGDVHKPGSFSIGTDKKVSVLQAISLAEGLGPQAATKNARIFRSHTGSSEKEEIHVDVSKILAGKGKDLEMEPSDILFIPDSPGKKATLRVAEAAIQAATGVVIWR
jgi:polysaccharide export outer membrane protein